MMNKDFIFRPIFWGSCSVVGIIVILYSGIRYFASNHVFSGVAAIILALLFGYAMAILLRYEIRPIIDLNADPLVIDGWTVEKHQKGGLFRWNPKKVQLYLSDCQKVGSSINGEKLREELEGKPVFNANLLDYLLAHPRSIPKEWKDSFRTHYIFFWDTIYQDSLGESCVRYLFWSGLRWSWCYYRLGRNWSVYDPAILHA